MINSAYKAIVETYDTSATCDTAPKPRNPIANLKNRAIGSSAPPASPPPGPEVPRSSVFVPCPLCGCSIEWLSIYRDGIRRCAVCEPWPSESLVAEFLGHGKPLPTCRRSPDAEEDPPDLADDQQRLRFSPPLGMSVDAWFDSLPTGAGMSIFES